MEWAKLVDYEQVSKICKGLRKVSTTNEDVRQKVLEIVNEVREGLRSNLVKWWDHGLDAQAEALVKRLFEALEILTKEPDEAARREWCIAAKTVAIELEIISKLHSAES